MFLKLKKKMGNKEVIVRKKDVVMVTEQSDGSSTVNLGKVTFSVSNSVEEIYEMLMKK